MEMNIVQMIAEVNRLVDRTKSARFDEQLKILPAIDLAIRQKFNDGCKDFQKNQVIRDYMSQLIVHRLAIVPVNINEIPYPDDYVHEVAFSILVDGKELSCRSATYNEINSLDWNAFTKPNDQLGLEQSYKIEANRRQYVSFEGTAFTNSFLSYIRNYKTPAKGTTQIVAGPTVLTIGLTYYVNLGTVTHNIVTYNTGDTFIAVSTVMTGVGNVLLIQNSEIGSSQHEAICQIAASDLLQNIEKFTNSQFKTQESKN